jgi:hypothetical protein
MPKPLAVVPELETELDALYALPPAEFTAARNDLARRLKQAGQEEPAARIKSLRKPTAPLWAVNQLARRNPEGIGRLLAVAEQLRKAQQNALGGGESAALRAATADERKIVRELTQEGDELLRESGHGAAGDRIAATLRAAAFTPGQRELLRQGRLSEELESSGFDALAGMEIPRASTRPRAPSQAERRRREERERKLRDQAAKMRREAAQAAREVREAEIALERARKKSNRAEEAEAQAEAELEALDLEE